MTGTDAEARLARLRGRALPVRHSARTIAAPWVRAHPQPTSRETSSQQKASHQTTQLPIIAE